MLVGVDFDNTIVCYDQLLHRLAVEQDLIPRELPPTKQSVRDFLRTTDRESQWTELQGIAYGPSITHAQPFPGVKACFARCRELGVRIAVVSHKTRHPYRGLPHDLHAAAHAFLALHGFYETNDTGLAPEQVYLELTLADKLARIGTLGCEVFVDDLPELLANPAFPSHVRKVLFDPANAHTDQDSYSRVTSWEECADVLIAEGSVFT